MTIPLDNLYDYIFSLTGHNNKNLRMYRFSPHGAKNMKNLILHNNVNNISVKHSNGVKANSWHYKSLFCHDQEPLNYNYYCHDIDERTQLFKNRYQDRLDGFRFNTDVGTKIQLKKNISGHHLVDQTIYDKILLLHSETNSDDLKKYEKNGFLGIYYWSHALIARDWYRFAEHDKMLKLDPKKIFSKDFNIYSRAWTGSREYRLKFLELLNKKNIDKKSNIFFNEFFEQTHYSEYEPKNEYYKIKRENIDSLFYTDRKINAAASATYNTLDYKNSAIDVVLETVFDRNKIQLTEKILRPIACGKPFILVSEKGSLKYLQSYGFKTFGDFIDESYDSINDPANRLHAITHTMKEISEMSTARKNKIFQKMHDIAKENKEWFFSSNFFNLIIDELANNLEYGLSLLDDPKYQTGKNPMFEYRVFRKYKKYLKKDTKNCVEKWMRLYPERIELSKKNIGKY